MLHARAGVPPVVAGNKGLSCFIAGEILAARRPIHSKRQLSSQGLYSSLLLAKLDITLPITRDRVMIGNGKRPADSI